MCIVLLSRNVCGGYDGDDDESGEQEEIPDLFLCLVLFL
jgi:hypothetical protein